MRNVFSAGDRVRGLPNNDYVQTTNGWEGNVVRTDTEVATMRVESDDGRTYDVANDDSLFELASRPSENRFLSPLRHSELYSPEAYAAKRVLVAGVGTIGSHLAQILARMQVPMHLFDHDTVEAHNLATQAYTAADIGILKVEAVAESVKLLDSPVSNTATASKYDGSPFPVDLVVSCVDSIDARREIAEGMVANGFSVPVVDGRVGGEQAEVYFYETPEKWLDDLPETADEDPCGARFTAYTAYVCAGLLANHVKRALLGQSVPKRLVYDAFSSTFIRVADVREAV